MLEVRAFRSISAPRAVLPNAGAVAPVPIAIQPIAAPPGLEESWSAMWRFAGVDDEVVDLAVGFQFAVGAEQLDEDMAADW